MKFLLILMVLGVGVLLPLQALINARLGQVTAGAVFAAAMSFLVGTVVLLLILVLSRTNWPSLDQLAKLPAWIWLGGVIGAVFVAAATLAVPRLGASALIALIVLGQMTGALLLDHFGVLHAPQPVTAARAVGAVLVVAGAMLVVQPWKH